MRKPDFGDLRPGATADAQADLHFAVRIWHKTCFLTTRLKHN